MKTVILDMYGVIIKEPGEGFVEHVKQTFPELSARDIYEQWLKADLGEISSLEVLKRLGYEGNLAKIEKDYLDTLEIDEGFFDFASKVKRTDKLGLISDDSIEWSKYLRDKFQINEFFNAIVISGDVKIKKPDHRIYKQALKLLECDSTRCIYIDDRVENVEAAKSLGMKGILFNTRNVEYEGIIVNNFEELAAMLDYK